MLSAWYVEMARLEVERGSDDHIRSHAREIIKEQQEQIERLTRWLKQWYGLTPEEPAADASPAARSIMAAMEEGMQANMQKSNSTKDGRHLISNLSCLCSAPHRWNHRIPGASSPRRACKIAGRSHLRDPGTGKGNC